MEKVVGEQELALQQHFHPILQILRNFQLSYKLTPKFLGPQTWPFRHMHSFHFCASHNIRVVRGENRSCNPSCKVNL